jgi:hypothetical protein
MQLSTATISIFTTTLKPANLPTMKISMPIMHRYVTQQQNVALGEKREV